MEFRLIYQGKLNANGSVKEKQELRRHFHLQLKQLWQQAPLKYNPLLIMSNTTPDLNILQKMGSFTFASLVCEKLKLVAELDITLLRPEAPGAVITQTGDIDNRLKTLFDALRRPGDQNEIPTGDAPLADEEPFFCLLEDDNLITKLTVATDRLLVKTQHPSEVVLVIHVVVKALIQTWQNSTIA